MGVIGCGFGASIRTRAEPGIISEYIMTMLSHDRPEADLRKFCIEELGAFLGDGEPSLL
jgi:hypothetical protein